MSRPSVDDMLLVAYADRELDPAVCREVELLMGSDPRVRERVEMFRRSADLLKAALDAGRYTDVPRSLARSAQRLIWRSRLRSLSREWAATAALVAGLMIGGATMIHLYPGATAEAGSIHHVLAEVAEYHSVMVKEDEHLVEVPASRKEHIESWLGKRVKLAFKVPDLKDYDLSFEGGRMFVVDGQPVAQLMYSGRGRERVALCIIQSDAGPSAPMQRFDSDGLTYLGKAQQDHIFVVAGSSGNAVLQRLAENLPALLTRS